MILGVEGIHTFKSLTMNDLTVDPHIKVRSIPGLKSLPELESIQDKASGRMGMVPRRSDRSGKTVTYEGILRATSLPDLLSLSDDMALAFYTNDEDEMTVAPHPDDPLVATLPTRTFWCRPISCDIAEEYQETKRTIYKGWTREFSIVLELNDPRFYWTEDHAITDASAPLSINAVNAGNCDTEALITINGANIEDIVLTNTTPANPKDLKLEGMVAGDNVDTIVIDSRRRRIRKGNGDNLREFFDPTSTWWDPGVPFLSPGNNVITLTGTNVTDFEIEWLDADII